MITARTTNGMDRPSSATSAFPEAASRSHITATVATAVKQTTLIGGISTFAMSSSSLKVGHQLVSSSERSASTSARPVRVGVAIFFSVAGALETNLCSLVTSVVRGTRRSRSIATMSPISRAQMMLTTIIVTREAHRPAGRPVATPCLDWAGGAA